MEWGGVRGYKWNHSAVSGSQVLGLAWDLWSETGPPVCRALAKVCFSGKTAAAFFSRWTSSRGRSDFFSKISQICLLQDV